MRNKDFAKLAKQLLPDLPGFSIKGPMMFIRPVKHVIRGLYFEGSSFDARSFYVWAFFLPLFVPTKHVAFNFGKRIREPGGGELWSADMPNLMAELNAAMKREALPFLSGVESLSDVAVLATSFQKTQDPYVQQAVAYALVLAGDFERAKNELDKLVRLLNVKIPWQCEMVERAESLKGKLLANPAEAQRQLELWEVESLRNLRVYQ